MAYDPAKHGTLEAVVEAVQPTALIGLTGCGGTFTRSLLKRMGELNRRPIVFALSNPTSNSECTAEDAYRATDGRAIFCSGSPFAPVTLDDGRTLFPGQGNNMYIFPGLGFGAWLGRSRISNSMVTAAAAELAHQTRQEDLDRGRVFPPLNNIRTISAHIAAAVLEQSFKEGLAQIERPEGALVDYVKRRMWEPHYINYTAQDE